MKKIKEFFAWLKWPHWYFVVVFTLWPLNTFQIVGDWAGFVIPAAGLFLIFYNKNFK